VVFPVRSDLQALSLAELDSAIKQPGPGFLEVFYTAVAELKGNPRFQGVDVKTVFLSPLTEDELSEIRYRVSQERAPSVEEVVTALMREKLINRTIREKGALPANDLPNIEERARSAIEEMRSAHLYDYVLPNHDGEDSPNWGASMAFGDAARTLGSFTQIMLRFVEGGPEIYAEQWRPGAVSEPPPPKPVEH
jgi:guanylate kinase